MPELAVSPAGPEDGGLIQRMLRQAQPGETVLLRDGVYPRQLVSGRTFARRVTVRGESRNGVVIDSLVCTDLRGISFENFTLAPSALSWGISVRGGGQLAFRRLVLDGAATATTSGRGIAVFGDSDDPWRWPADIVIERCVIARFFADLIFIAGAREIRIEANILADVQLNEDHNDAVQVVAADGLRVERNLISCPPTILTGSTPPDQAIICSTVSGQTIKRGIIAGNRIRNWPGTAIILSGAGVSGMEVYGNEMLAARGGLVMAGNLGPGCADYANTFLSSGPAPPFALDGP